MHWHPGFGFIDDGIDLASAAFYEKSIAQLGEAKDLPRQAYMSKIFADLENEKIWSRGWITIGFKEQLPNIGDILPFTVGNHGIHVERIGEDHFAARFNFAQHGGCRSVPVQCQTGKKTSCSYTSCGFSRDRVAGFQTNLNHHSSEAGHFIGSDPQKVSTVKIAHHDNRLFVNLAKEDVEGCEENTVRNGENSFISDAHLDFWTQEINANWKTIWSSILEHAGQYPTGGKNSSKANANATQISGVIKSRAGPFRVSGNLPNFIRLQCGTTDLCILIQPSSPRSCFLRLSLWGRQLPTIDADHLMAWLRVTLMLAEQNQQIMEERLNGDNGILKNSLKHQFIQWVSTRLLAQYLVQPLPQVFSPIGRSKQARMAMVQR